VVELASLSVGVYWVITHASIGVLRRQFALMAYLFVLLLSASVSSDPVFVLLQVMTLAAVALFAVAYFATVDSSVAVTSVLVPALCAYSLVLAGSLVYGHVAPTGAFESGWGDSEPRFRGLFGEPAEIGMVAGLTIGFALFVRTWWMLRIPAFVVAMACVYFTYSRTFWVAVVVSVGATLWVYRPKLRLPMAISVVVFASALAGNLDTIIKSNERVLRADSLTNLSGRTEIWGSAIAAFEERPWLGYGFTLGADGIMNSGFVKGLRRGNEELVKTPTLHNGYVQAMLDSGAPGLTLYCVIVVGALVRLWRKDTDKQFAPVMYVLVFSMIGNIGETYIFGAAQSHQSLYWMLAVFALGFDPGVVNVPRRLHVPTRRAGPAVALRLSARPTYSALRSHATRGTQ
jgi:O-antigen ligase